MGEYCDLLVELIVQAASVLKTGSVDGIIDATGNGSSWTTDIVGDGTEFDFIPLTEDHIKELTGKANEFSRMDIPANTYKGQTENVPAVGVHYVVVARADLSPDNIKTGLSPPCIRARRGTTRKSARLNSVRGFLRLISHERRTDVRRS